jgi:hypothetical protein
MSHIEELIPGAVKLAAKRAFIRTTFQAYAATIPAGGVSAAVLASVVNNPEPVAIVTTVVAALVSPPLAGLAAYLNIASQGIPVDYTVAAISQGQVVVAED